MVLRRAEKCVLKEGIVLAQISVVTGRTNREEVRMRLVTAYLNVEESSTFRNYVRTCRQMYHGEPLRIEQSLRN